MQSSHDIDADRALVTRAAEFIRRQFVHRRHHVGAALRCRSGHIVLGVHLDSPAIDICAEAVALGTATCQGEHEFECIVAVSLDRDGTPRVLPPCGACRELLHYFAPQISILVIRDGQLTRVSTRELLPDPYHEVYREGERDVNQG